MRTLSCYLLTCKSWLVSLIVGAAIVPSQADEPAELIYATVQESKLKLDLYQPTLRTAEASPTVIWIHGGAWRSGTKRDVPVKEWLTHGIAIASVEYRLSPVAKFPAQIHDIKAAIRYLRDNAGPLKLDPNKFAIAGSSAGGHLAALVGVSNQVKELEGAVGDNLQQSSNVQAIVSFYGAANLQSILSQSTEHGLSVRVPALQLLLGGQPTEVPVLTRLASPIVHVDSTDPPLWLIHGDADPQMPLQQSKELQFAYEQAKLPVSLDVIAGGKHGGKEFFSTRRLADLAKKLHEVLSH